MRQARVVVLEGDGIGPEVVAVAREVVDRVAPEADLEVTWDEHLMGGCSIDVHGTALTDEVLAECQAADAVLLGAVGGPKWDTTDPLAPRPEQGLLGLRAGLAVGVGRAVPQLVVGHPDHLSAAPGEGDGEEEGRGSSHRVQRRTTRARPRPGGVGRRPWSAVR